MARKTKQTDNMMTALTNLYGVSSNQLTFDDLEQLEQLTVPSVEQQLIDEESKYQAQDAAFTKRQDAETLSIKRTLADWILNGSRSLNIKGINNFGNGRKAEERYKSVRRLCQDGSTFELSYAIQNLYYLARTWKLSGAGKTLPAWSDLHGKAFGEVVTDLCEGWHTAKKIEDRFEFARSTEPKVKVFGVEYSILWLGDFVDAMEAFMHGKDEPVADRPYLDEDY